jgi:hypothetical protein
MKTQTKYTRIAILCSLAAILLFPFISSAQLRISTTGGGSIGDTTSTANGLKVFGGDINLDSPSKAYMIDGNKVVWHNDDIHNIFVGVSAGTAITSGTYNAFTGYLSGNGNTSGTFNTASGAYALSIATSGSYNSAFGYSALTTATTASDNTGIGSRALIVTTGGDNTGVGFQAGANNVAGYNNTFIGSGADYSGSATISNAAAIGYGAVTNASNKIYIGNSSNAIWCINGFFSGSDGRFKTNVTENVKGLAFIKKLRPVTYKMNTEAFDDFLIQNLPDSLKTKHKQGMDFTESSAVTHSGFIAQEVEQASQDVNFVSSIVSAPKNASDHYSLNYSEIVVPLVKAVQEQQKMIEDQDSIIQAQADKLNDLQNQILNCCTSGKNSSGSNTNGNNSNTPNLNDNISEGGVSANSSALLYQNTPNPFNQQTSIQYFIPTNAKSASIMVFDLNGKLMSTFPINTFGKNAVTINSNKLSPGMFVYSLVVDGAIIDTKRMILTE